MPFAMKSDQLLNAAYAKLTAADGAQPELAQVLATQAVALATMANAQATVDLVHAAYEQLERG